MVRFAILALCAAACGRSQGVADQDLPGLVVEERKADPPIDVARAAKDPAELGRALSRPYRVMLASLGPHVLVINSGTTVEEAGTAVSDLSDHAQVESGERGAYHALYINSADYGRETTFVDGKLYLRPRYQRWHARSPETPDEPVELRDQYAGAIAATWDLIAPAVELTDRGAVEVAGRPGRKIEIHRAPTPQKPPIEPVAQRKWRESRSIDAVAGEIVLDAEKGVPLAVKLTGSVGFSRDGRRFTMKLSLDSTISGLGTPTAITVPAEGEVVATPERLREVDDRDYLLQGIAPPIRKNSDGTGVVPAPAAPAPTPAPKSDKPVDKPKADKPDKPAGDDKP
ncbi:MAG: hypothetical protein H7138_21495 [Myxococcales bacterium]|nr:hypothetical protein [Myxococcales bacterium]